MTNSTSLRDTALLNVAPLPESGRQTMDDVLGTAAAAVQPPLAPILPTSRHQKDHTPAEWEAVRSRFTELYLQERKRFADVTRILREEGGFHATEKQDKDRIRKWGLRKNFKDGEKREALPTGVDAELGDHIVTKDGNIPRHRLKRFARDAKLLYVRRMAAGATLPPKPDTESDIIIELPRSIFQFTGTSDERDLHAAFAAIDRLSRRRWPILTFEVLGVSDAVVRYGMRRRERKPVPGLSFEAMPAVDALGRKQGAGMRFALSMRALRANYKIVEEEQSHMALFHLITLRLYQACQQVYASSCLAQNDNSSLPGQPPPMQCIKFEATPLATQRLYLRAMTESSLSGALRYGDPSSDCEMISVPGMGAGDLVLTMKQTVNVVMHAAEKGDIVAGAIQFRPGFEATPILAAGAFEQQTIKMQSTLSQSPGPGFLAQLVGTLQGQSEPYLTEGDPPEKEFKEASRRAASSTARLPQADTPMSMFLIQTPAPESWALPEPQRQWVKLVTEECLVDSNEPWKLATRFQSTPPTQRPTA